ncbi:YggT family protein [Gimibacter soli]|uniref:YggT family protein n=1 Tax=Gimibacter soli TaxID=3024400 RepID=A0AAF0BLQ4_9PROT|nr:YggT family protein [Gimibacter soli]WCL54437.1 YggT family protein [Gimibacter soli]
MTAIFMLIDTVLYLYSTALIIWVIMSWLVSFGVINSYQPFVRTVMAFFDAITAPILNPIRRIIPNVGGFDISPIILLLLIHFLRVLFATSVAPMFGVYGW